GDTKYQSMRDPAPRQVFLDLDTHPDPTGSSVYVKTRYETGAMFARLRQAVRDLDPNVPVFGMRTLDEQVDRDLASARLLANLASGFGVVAVLLAAVGLYGLLAFNVTRRTNEIGIRIALGAERGAIVWLILKESLLLAFIGALLAIPAALGLSGYVRSELYGI